MTWQRHINKIKRQGTTSEKVFGIHITKNNVQIVKGGFANPEDNDKELDPLSDEQSFSISSSQNKKCKGYIKIRS